MGNFIIMGTIGVEFRYRRDENIEQRGGNFRQKRGYKYCLSIAKRTVKKYLANPS